MDNVHKASDSERTERSVTFLPGVSVLCPCYHDLPVPLKDLTEFHSILFGAHWKSNSNFVLSDSVRHSINTVVMGIQKPEEIFT
jgi:hypothetical protein